MSVIAPCPEAFRDQVCWAKLADEDAEKLATATNLIITC